MIPTPSAWPSSKQRTTWTQPDDAYEKRVTTFVESILTALINDLAAVGSDVMLVIDDYQLSLLAPLLAADRVSPANSRSTACGAGTGS